MFDSLGIPGVAVINFAQTNTFFTYHQETVVSIGAIYCLRPYNVESTSYRLITEVMPNLARLVLGWVTPWEYLVLQTLFLLRQILNLHFHLSSGNICEYRSNLLSATIQCGKHQFSSDKSNDSKHYLLFLLGLHGFIIPGDLPRHQYLCNKQNLVSACIVIVLFQVFYHYSPKKLIYWG